MTVQELIDQLKTFPPDLKVWVSDGGYVEGSMPLTSLEVVSAFESGLDGDEVDDEWAYPDEEVGLNPDDYPFKYAHSIDAGIKENIWSKAIVLIKTALDK